MGMKYTGPLYSIGNVLFLRSLGMTYISKDKIVSQKLINYRSYTSIEALHFFMSAKSESCKGFLKQKIRTASTGKEMMGWPDATSLDVRFVKFILEQCSYPSSNVLITSCFVSISVIVITRLFRTQTLALQLLALLVLQIHHSIDVCPAIQLRLQL